MSRPVSINPAPPAATAGVAALAVIGLQYAIARPEEDALRELLVVTGLIVVAAAIVFGLIVPRAVARGGSPGTALTLSLLGLVLAAAYWSGIPPVMAIGGIVLARRSAPGGVTTAATAVGVLALVADLAVVIADGLAG
jgi:ABC-type sulfate transport system permease subunit